MDGSALHAALQRAATLFASAEFDTALALLESLAPQLGDSPHWHYNRALVLGALRRTDLAFEALAKARECGMDEAEVACQEGLLWQGRGALQRAEEAYLHALAAVPQHRLARLNLGALLLIRKDFVAARDSLDAVSDAPQLGAGLPAARWLARRHLAQWDASAEQLVLTVLRGLARNEATCEPFTALPLVDDPALQFSAARSWFGRPLAGLGVRSAAAVRAGAKLRVAYFSSDFHDHATMHLLAGVLEAHDRTRLEVVCFSWGPPTRDAYQRRVMQAVDAFIEVHGWADQAVADRARSLEIDLAIDLKGATHDARPGIFAARAAPVQVNYLGFAGTLGQPWWDYLVSDAVVAPPGAEAQCCEKLVRLPHSYQPNDRARVQPQAVPDRAACGLPHDGLVLACFNAHYKIGPPVWDAWMAVLRAVPGAVLWLLEGHPQARQNLCAAAQAAGVDSARLVFAPWLPQAQHLARLPLADLMLDTWPCNAHTTASDALWMGVPLLTCAGRSFAARVAASVLTAAGLPQLVCTDVAQYTERAIALARDPVRLQALRLQCISGRERSALFDTARYTRSLEAAWWAMVQRQQAGLPPTHFRVQES